MRTRLHFSRAFPFLVGGFLGCSLAAQSNAMRMTSDRYGRAHDYDLLHQRVEVKGFDWDSLGFEGRVTTTLRSLRVGLDSIRLDAGRGLQIRGVRVVGRPAARRRLGFVHRGDTLFVKLARPAAFDDTVTFVIEYSARIRNGHGLTFIEADTVSPRRPRQLWSQGQDDNNHEWFPTWDFPNDRMTWEVIATVPKDLVAVSNGRLVADRRNRDGTRTLHWRQEHPAVTYLVSLVVSRLVRLEDRWRDTPLEYWAYPWDTTAAQTVFRDTPDMMEVFSRLTGVAYPWPRYAQVTVADFFGGMENVGASTMVDWLPGPRAWVDRPWYHYVLIPHELAHQWFGNYVTMANWAHMWLNEGFAEFLPGQYWEERLGSHAGQDYYLDEYLRFLAIEGRRSMPLASLGSNNIYPKGALILEMLRRYLGPERFWAGVRRYLENHALGLATTDDLRQAFLQATGEDLDWFWNQWIYQAGLPEFRVTAAWDSMASRVTLNVRQQQPDTLSPDSTGLRFTVPAAFRMPVTVRIGTARGDVVVRAALERREQEIVVEGVSEPPAMVVFDDGNTILKRLAFDQPTAWLATQLEREPDLWNRWWVIRQLASRRGDPRARAALIRAATTADYSLTRAQAAEALAPDPDEEATGALLLALRDTSARVRAAAASALGAIPRGGAVEALERVWHGDSSDGVRAAALPALATLVDPVRARGLLREGLRVPSYRDEVREASLAAAYRLDIRDLLGAIDSLVRYSGEAAYLLAAWAALGDREARARLEPHLLSPRDAERRRAIRAVTDLVPDSVAQEWLEALVNAAPNGRTRADILAAKAGLAPR